MAKQVAKLVYGGKDEFGRQGGRSGVEVSTNGFAGTTTGAPGPSSQAVGAADD